MVFFLPLFYNFGIPEYFVKSFNKGHNIVKGAYSVVKHQCYGQSLFCCNIDLAIFVPERIVAIFDNTHGKKENLG